MAYDPAVTLERLKMARDTGVLTIHHGDTSTTYRSLDEINQIIRQLEAQVPPVPGVPRRQRVRYLYQLTKGY